MAWNEPGNNNKDPWGNKNKNDGPPELDEMLNNLSKKISKFFGGSGKGGGNAAFGIIPVIVVALIIWAAQGIYTINEQERGVVLRFGEFDRIETSGLGWVPLGVEKVKKVNVNKLREQRVAGVILTKDLNLIDVEIGIQYRVDNPKDYLFELAQPENTLNQAAESVLRQVVGDNGVDDLLTTEKERIRIELQNELVRVIATYRTGLQIQQVTLEKAAPPIELNDAFEDVNRAEQDAKRAIQNAEEYRNKKLPFAQADAEKARQQADAYQAEVLAKANGEVSRFKNLLPQYEAAPEVTRDRLYIEMMEEVLSNSTKVMIDVDGSNNMMYIPLDKIMNKKDGR
jgi:modulator of FtsH protease HflK